MQISQGIANYGTTESGTCRASPFMLRLSLRSERESSICTNRAMQRNKEVRTRDESLLCLHTETLETYNLEKSLQKLSVNHESDSHVKSSQCLLLTFPSRLHGSR